MNHLPLALGRLHGTEQQLAEVFSELAKRHGEDYEVARGCTLFARWAETHLTKLQELIGEFGTIPDPEPASIRKALFQRSYSPGVALLRDLEGLLTLAHQSGTAWICLEQAAKVVKNRQLKECVAYCSAHLDREIAWLETQLKNAAPQALLVG